MADVLSFLQSQNAFGIGGLGWLEERKALPALGLSHFSSKYVKMQPPTSSSHNVLYNASILFRGRREEKEEEDNQICWREGEMVVVSPASLLGLP